MAFGPAIRVPSDASAALWIAPTLGSFGTVGGLVPRAYERYLLFDYRSGQSSEWVDVPRLFEQLVPVLARYTSAPDPCWFAIWEGYGFDTSTTFLVAMPSDDEEHRDLERERQHLREDDVQRNKSVRTALSRVPSFDLPDRRYYLVCGAVTAASEIESPDGRFPQRSDLRWLEDRQWFVGGEH